ncbi:hypothetical protein BC828DRAFT_405173 [Blastocladiella britannica]|nr:hypothetical protein BC828DRAFT_405173 [Blastocladiella britannica]
MPATTTTVNGSAPKAAAPKRARRKPKKKVVATEKAAAAPGVRLEEDDTEGVDIDYVPAAPVLDDVSDADPALAEYFGSVFAKFEATDAPARTVETNLADGEADNDADRPAEEDRGSDSDSDSDAEDVGPNAPLSNRKLKKAARLSVAELKQLVDKPEIVEWVDVTAPDPKLLVDLKGTRNTVPVPLHWSLKRKYLQNKRGLEKEPFRLPEFILATGILEMREAVGAKEDGSSLKSRTRERTQPKMGKLVIDYAKLHSAFFKWQTKPPLTGYGDMYYEGREFEARVRHIRPGGELTSALREALGMPPVSQYTPPVPPPFLIHMQRHGPPPSYPGLKVPGLNAPIPPGAVWGFHPGGWGRPPVDEYGRPLFGDVYGPAPGDDPMALYRDAVAAAKSVRWGEIAQPQGDESNDEDEDGDDDDEDADRISGGEEEEVTEVAAAAPRNKSGGGGGDMPLQFLGDAADPTDEDLEAFAANLGAPSSRGGRPGPQIGAGDGIVTETPQPPRELYTVVGERSATGQARSAGTLLGSDRVYDVRKRAAPGIETETPLPPGAVGAGDGGNDDGTATARKRRRVDDSRASAGSSSKSSRNFKF